MPAPWIAAWKALLSRVAERFVQPGGPVDETTPRRVPPAKRQGHATHGPATPANARKGPPHRSGQRHG
ncbi:MAG: hypothetical protein ACK4F7_01485 [Inhella sp.]